MYKALSFVLILSFIGFTACTNSGNKNANSSADSSNNLPTEQQPEQNVKNNNTLPSVPKEAKVFFKNLEDGQTVSSPIKIEMGIKGMKVEPSGEVHQGFGHHHLLIDQGDFFEKGKVIPADSTHIHFGGGQTETEIDLPAGEHKLTLQFADGIHRSYGKQLASSITITVE